MKYKIVLTIDTAAATAVVEEENACQVSYTVDTGSYESLAESTGEAVKDYIEGLG